MVAPMNAAVEQYLAVGFVPDSERAERYLDQVLTGPDPASSDPETLLATILAECLSGVSEIVIPVSGGYDSRGLLGAALRLLPKNAITCLTMGQLDSNEWKFPAAACERNGIRHERLDPDHFVWDLDEMVDIAKEHAKTKGNGLPQIDAYFVHMQVAKRVGSGIPVLSGYFGGAISGAYLRPDGVTTSAKADARRFILANMNALDGLTVAGLPETFVRFVAANERRLQQFRSLTRYDLLNFGFRLTHVARIAVTDQYENCIKPYEDPRWVRFWLQRPFADRLHQRLYKEFLRSAYPTVFAPGEENPYRVAPGKRPLLRLATLWGDPRVNKSMVVTLRRAAESFDRRGLWPIKFLPNAERLATSPTDARYVRARSVLSAEVNLRAGLL